MRLPSLSLAALLSCGLPAMAEAPRVATDITPVQSLVARVMQGAGEADVIVSPGMSPHGYAMRPSEARALEQADLVIWMGAELTPWMEHAIETLAGDAAVITLLDNPETHTLPTRTGARFEATITMGMTTTTMTIMPTIMTAPTRMPGSTRRTANAGSA